LVAVSVLPGCTTTATTSTGSTTPPSTTNTSQSIATSTTAAEVAELDTNEVYALVAPALALVSGPGGVTAGLLVDESRLLVSTQAVWFDSAAEVLFPNGIVVSDARVVGLDTLAGVALLDLTEVEGLPAPVTVLPESALSLGTDVLFVGYSFSDPTNPHPALAEGLVTESRTWEAGQVTFITTDAPASFDFRGVVATATGGVLAAALPGNRVSAWLPSVDGLLRRARTGEGKSSAESWSEVVANAGVGAIEVEATLAAEGVRPLWLVDADEGDSVEISADSTDDVALDVIGPDGLTLATADEGLEGAERVSFTIEVPGPHFVRLTRFGGDPIEVHVESSHPLVDIAEGEAPVLDDLGSSLEGAIDYPGDTDTYGVDLEGGTDVVVSVQSVIIDPYACISSLGTPEDPISCDDDLGGGFFGLDSRLVLSIEETGTYLIQVRSYDQSVAGGYLLSIEADE
jgi:hypothetical protein